MPSSHGSESELLVLEIKEAALKLYTLQDRHLKNLSQGKARSLKERHEIVQESEELNKSYEAFNSLLQSTTQKLNKHLKSKKSRKPPKPLVRGICDNPSCSAQSVHRCSRCLQAAFCSMQCHVTHRPVHQGDCVPWRQRQKAERKAEVD